MKKLILLTVMLLAAATSVAVADQSQYKKIDLSKKSGNRYKPLDLPYDSVRSGARFTVSTNLLEWAIVAPNIGIEYDLKDPEQMSSPSLYFQFTLRPGQYDMFPAIPGVGKTEYSSNNIAFWRARFEYRWHFRFNERMEQRKGLAKAASWVNERYFTKSVETYVPDTAAINAGDEYATMAIKSRQPEIDRKIDSTMISTLNRREKMFPGRWYAGIYGDIYGYNMNQKLDVVLFGSKLKGKTKIGNAISAGLSAGYEFPGFNYNHKLFMQWSIGASIGGIVAVRNDVYESGKPFVKSEDLSGFKFIPIPVSELRVALNFRNTTISKKYWQPDNSVYEKNIMQNRDDSIHMAEIDSVLEHNPVVIRVHSVNGMDSAYTEVLDKLSIVQAFQQSTGLTYLLPQNFNILPVTQDGLNKKELSDNYFVEYVISNRLRNYEDSVFISDRKNLKFAIEIAGRQEADSLMQSFKDSLTHYYEANNNSRPIFYGEPATKDSLKGYISKDTIAAVFSRIWGHTLDTTMIRALYMNRTVMNEDGTTTNFLDSIIGDTAINRGSINYGMFIQFHPQVTMSAEDFGVARFRVGMEGADRARELFNNVATYFNTVLAKQGVPRIQRSWNFENDSFPNVVTKEELLELMAKQGLAGDFTPDMVSMRDSIFTFNNMGGTPDTITFNFGVTENPLSVPFIVEDSVGKAQAQNLYQTLREYYASNYWQYLPDDDPIVPTYYDEENDVWNVHIPTFLEVLSKIEPLQGVTILPQQVDTVVVRVQKNKQGAYTKFKTGFYRGTAQFRFHREIRNRSGQMLTMRLPYQLKRVDSMEEAGFVEEELDENGNPLPKPEMIGPSFTKVELYDEMGKAYKCQVYTDSTGAKIHIVPGKEPLKVILDEFGDVGSTEPLSQELIDWITPKAYFRDAEGNLVEAVKDEEGRWINPLTPRKKVLKPEMIGPEFTTEEMYDEMGKAYKVNIYTDSLGNKTRVLPNSDGTFSAVVLDEFGDFGGTDVLADSILAWITPKPFFRDSVGTLIPALKDENGDWIDPFAEPEVATDSLSIQQDGIPQIVEEVVDLESMTPQERKAYEKQKKAEEKAKIKAAKLAEKEAKKAAKKAAAEAKKAAKLAAAEAKKNKGKAPEAAQAAGAAADSAFNALSDSISSIASGIEGVSTEVVNLPQQNAEVGATEGTATSENNNAETPAQETENAAETTPAESTEESAEKSTETE